MFPCQLLSEVYIVPIGKQPKCLILLCLPVSRATFSFSQDVTQYFFLVSYELLDISHIWVFKFLGMHSNHCTFTRGKSWLSNLTRIAFVSFLSSRQELLGSPHTFLACILWLLWRSHIPQKSSCIGSLGWKTMSEPGIVRLLIYWGTGREIPWDGHWERKRLYLLIRPQGRKQEVHTGEPSWGVRTLTVLSTLLLAWLPMDPWPSVL
jgi:hypothetical protein